MNAELPTSGVISELPRRIRPSAMLPALTQLAMLMLACAALAACDGDGGQSRRVEARTGQVVLGSAMDEFNFSIELPEEWDVREDFEWRADVAARGWVGLPAEKSDEESRVFIQWLANDMWDEGVFSRARREGHTIEETSIGGASVHIIYPATGLPGRSPRRTIGAVFKSMPGAPAGTAATPLTLHGFVFPDQAIDEIVLMFKSVRYAPLPPPPPPPVTTATPGPDWVVLSGGQTEHGFPLLRRTELTVPPGSSARLDTGYDNSVITIKLDGIQIKGEMGSANSVMTIPDPDPEVRVWREQVDDVWGYFARIRRSDGMFDLQVFYPEMAQTIAGVPNGRSAALFLEAESVPEDRQGEVLAVFKSIRYGD